MKQLTTLITLFLICLSGSALADVPTSMNVQGKLTDSTGESLGERFMEFTFRIFTAPTGGILMYSDGLQEVYVDASGLWNARVGAVNPLPETVFQHPVRWLEITVGDSANLPETLPRIKLNTTPYSYWAKWSQKAWDAERLNGFTADVFADSGHGHSVTTADIVDSTILLQDIGQNGAAIGQILKWNGSGWAVADDEVGSGLLPSNYFQAYGSTSSVTGVVLWSAIGIDRHITGIMASSTITGGEGFLSLRINGEGIFLAQLSAVVPNFTWSAQGGAPIVVESGDELTLHYSGAASGTVLITGLQ